MRDTIVRASKWNAAPQDQLGVARKKSREAAEECSPGARALGHM